MDNLQTLRRGLTALQYMNEVGTANLAQVARHLKVPRSNAHRIIQTLVGEGYLERLPSSRLYKLTALVKQLSAGFDDDDLLTKAAQPAIERLAEGLVWPIAMATPYGANMLVRVSTDYRSPVALVRTHSGYVTPMLQATTGLLFLALSNEETRNQVVGVIEKQNQFAPFFDSHSEFQKVLRQARKDRYIIQDTRFAEGSLGVPLLWEKRILGGLVVRYIRKAVTRKQAVAELLPKLLKLSEEVIVAFDALIKEKNNERHS
jgi:IclR family mhp operon transcriptional activator